MAKLARAIAAQLRWMLACLAVSVFALAAVGLWSLTISTGAANELYHDKLQTLQTTSGVSDAIRDTYEQAVTVLTTTDAGTRTKTAERLFNTTIPNVDVGLDALRRLPTIDSRTEKAEVARISSAWIELRDSIVPDIAVIHVDGPGLLARVDTQTAAIHEATARLVAQEERESSEASNQAHSAWLVGVLLIIGSAAAAFLAGTIVVVRGARRLVGRAVADEAAQQDFAHAMQLASNEDDAYRVMSRHLERVIAKARAVILNRNNSADRLEAMTPVPSDWPLAQHLEGASPQSCAAVRSARAYRREPDHQPLLSCDVCAACPNRSICTPITVGGEIIGSVLVERNAPLDDHDETRIDQTVAQGAPVLANLRNLAIAEFRAATDVLTGLPNKRAVTHALKRLVAQASRTVTPLAVLSMDLDHFKQINDRYGHPIGDEVLAAVGAVLQTTIREADFAGRNGGEEFLILLPATDRVGAHHIAETIAASIRDIRVHSVDHAITTSIGIAVLPDDAGDADDLARAADRALYTAKTNGRDRIETTRQPGSFLQPHRDAPVNAS